MKSRPEDVVKETHLSTWELPPPSILRWPGCLLPSAFARPRRQLKQPVIHKFLEVGVNDGLEARNGDQRSLLHEPNHLHNSARGGKGDGDEMSEAAQAERLCRWRSAPVLARVHGLVLERLGQRVGNKDGAIHHAKREQERARVKLISQTARGCRGGLIGAQDVLPARVRASVSEYVLSLLLCGGFVACLRLLC